MDYFSSRYMISTISNKIRHPARRRQSSSMLKVIGEKYLWWRERLCQIIHTKLFGVAEADLVRVAVAAIFWFAKLAAAYPNGRKVPEYLEKSKRGCPETWESANYLISSINSGFHCTALIKLISFNHNNSGIYL